MKQASSHDSSERIVDLVKRIIELEEAQDNLLELREKCFSVFEVYAGITMEYIEQTVKNEWPKLLDIVPSYYFDKTTGNIARHFSDMKDGFINRKEFKENMLGTVNAVNNYYQEIGNDLKQVKNRFASEYNSFIQKLNTAKSKENNKYLLFALEQPEALKLFFKFLQTVATEDEDE